MTNVNGPLIVRRSEPAPLYSLKPGIHSHNRGRRRPQSRGRGVLHLLRTALFIFGICGIGYYAYTVVDQYVYQNYENWAFDQDIAGRRGVTFADYVRERTPFVFLTGSVHSEPRVATAPPPTPMAVAPPAHGSVLGRVEIPRLNLAAIVREGVDAKTLSVAVGHVPSTALPGQPGNFAIAAHRDTLFRALKDIQQGDLVKFQSPAGTYTYQVLATKIVVPSNVTVLRADGGGIIPAMDLSVDSGQPKLLTMITCYPFYYVGSAPKRFVVEAKLVSNDAISQVAAAEPPQAAPAPEHRAPREHVTARRPRPVRVAVIKTRVPKKRSFWHRVFHTA